MQQPKLSDLDLTTFQPKQLRSLPEPGSLPAPGQSRAAADPVTATTFPTEHPCAGGTLGTHNAAEIGGGTHGNEVVSHEQLRSENTLARSDIC